MKRIFWIINALCLPLLLCGPVMAQHTGPYLGAFIGGSALMDAKGNDDLGSFGLKFEPALLGSAVVGWDFEPGNPVGEGRIELEYTRRSNPLDKVKFVQGNFKGDGDLTADSLLINFIGVFHTNSRWSPYVGLGAGAALVKASDLKEAGYPLSNSSAVAFAYQAAVGVDFTLTERLSLDFGYRFFGCLPPTFKESGGHTFKMDYYSHNLVLGLRYGF
ncbi:MAG: porin family protein [Desulfuromonadales bacterium]|nr:porin family protein [Desulfuromonadales bacterium]